MKALLKNERTSHLVKDVFDITPLECMSMQKKGKFTIKKMAIVEVTFKKAGFDEPGKRLKF